MTGLALERAIASTILVFGRRALAHLRVLEPCDLTGTFREIAEVVSAVTDPGEPVDLVAVASLLTARGSRLTQRNLEWLAALAEEETYVPRSVEVLENELVRERLRTRCEFVGRRLLVLARERDVDLRGEVCVLAEALRLAAERAT